jgi:hypothetical protein
LPDLVSKDTRFKFQNATHLVEADWDLRISLIPKDHNLTGSTYLAFLDVRFARLLYIRRSNVALLKKGVAHGSSVGFVGRPESVDAFASMSRADNKSNWLLAELCGNV